MTRQRSRLALPLLGALTLWALPALAPSSHVAAPAKLAASGPWLDRFNQWRSNARVAAVTEDPNLSSGDYLHAQYMVLNDLVTHYETPGTPYYTTAGDTAARNSNIFVSSSTSTTDTDAIDWWMGAPFHAMGMMDPALQTTGFGSYRASKPGWDMGAAVNVLSGNPWSGGTFPVYFPGNGTTEPLTQYSGNEFPDPLQACPGYSSPTGLPLFIELGKNMSTTAGPVHSLTGNGAPLAHCVIDSSNSAVGSYLSDRGGVIVIPQQPLQQGVKYVVALTVNGAPYTWSFTVGPFVTCVSVSATTDKSSPQPVGTSVTFTAASTGCPTPQYEIWVRPPGGACCQLLSPYGSSATYLWNTTGLAAGTYAFSIWAKDAKSNGAFSNSFGSYDAAVVTSFTIGSECAAANVTADKISPQAIGATVTLSASASACPNPRYEFWVLPPGAGTYVKVQPYSAVSQYPWVTTGHPAGLYHFIVFARDAASAGLYSNSVATWDAYTTLTYTLSNPTACTSAAATFNPPSPQPVGVPITLTATSGGTCPNPLYEFWMLPPGAGTYVDVQPYSAASTYNWATATSAPGLYHFVVFVRDAGSPGTASNNVATWDAYAMVTYQLNPPGTTCTAVTGTTALSGSVVTVTGHAVGCPNPVYEFWLRTSTSGSYVKVQPYSAANSYAWSIAGAPSGTYFWIIFARDAGSAGTQSNAVARWDAYAQFSYLVP